MDFVKPDRKTSLKTFYAFRLIRTKHISSTTCINEYDLKVIRQPLQGFFFLCNHHMYYLLATYGESTFAFNFMLFQNYY